MKKDILLKDCVEYIEFNFSADFLYIFDNGNNNNVDEIYECFKLEVVDYVKEQSMKDINFNTFVDLGYFRGFLRVGMFIYENIDGGVVVNIFGVEF